MQSDDQTQRVLHQGRLLVWGRQWGRILLVLLAGVLAPLAFRHVWAWGTSAGSPRLELSTMELNLGEGTPNQTLRGKLLLRNTGAAPLTFSIERSCGCTLLEPESGVILPGDKLSVAVALRLPGYVNAEKSASLFVESNDPTADRVQCVMTGRCPSPFHVDRHYVNFGQVLQHNVANVVEEVRVSVVGAEEGLAIEGLRVRPSSDDFRVERRSGQNGVVVLRLSLHPEAEVGNRYGAIELQLTDRPHVLRIPVRAQVVEPVVAVPSVVTLRRSTEANGVLPVEILFLSRQQTPLGNIKLIDDRPGIRILGLESPDSTRRRIRLEIEDASALDGDSQLRFAVEGADHVVPLEVITTPLL